jgi:hypothetical protein
MRRFACFAGLLVISLVLALAPSPGAYAPDPPRTELRFEVTMARGLLAAPREGRVLVVLNPNQAREPRATIGDTGAKAPPLMGVDVKDFAPGKTAVVDQDVMVYPYEHLARIPAGKYWAQAVFDHNPDLHLPDAPDNLYSDPLEIMLDPLRGGTIRLELKHKIAAEELPRDTALVRYLKFRSELLSKFHGRPIYLRAGVVLPRDFDREPERRYPLRLHIGGFGDRYTEVGDMMAEGASFRRAWLAEKAPKMLLLHLDGAGPLGDPYQVNSDCHGPYGDAVVKELIPHVEKTFRGLGKPHARVQDGHSTGGWVSLALQVFYPDFFGGAWAHAPDPVDFHAFELIDLYSDDNAYINSHGFERPGARDINGDTRFTVRNEVLRERVMGRGNRWELSGKDWGSWNAVFGGRKADGTPAPLWDGATGKLDPTQVEHWKQYDLRRILERDWKALGPKLRGKLRVWVGEADDYFLNDAVHLLDDFLRTARPAAQHRFVYGSRKNHGWRGLTWGQLLQEMGDASARAEKEP